MKPLWMHVAKKKPFGQSVKGENPVFLKIKDLTKKGLSMRFAALNSSSGKPAPVSSGFFVPTDLILGRDDTAKYKTASAGICGEPSFRVRLSPGTHQVPQLEQSKTKRTMKKQTPLKGGVHPPANWADGTSTELRAHLKAQYDYEIDPLSASHKAWSKCIKAIRDRLIEKGLAGEFEAKLAELGRICNKLHAKGKVVIEGEAKLACLGKEAAA